MDKIQFDGVACTECGGQEFYRTSDEDIPVPSGLSLTHTIIRCCACNHRFRDVFEFPEWFTL